MGKKLDLMGQRFGMLTVIAEGGRTKDKKVKWFCQCDCGNQCEVVGKELKSGGTKSCGCLAKHNHAGKRFGNFVAIKPIKLKSRAAGWLCECDCGNQKEVLTSNLTRGKSASCGCLRSPDITGSKVGRLTVLERLDKQDSSGFGLCICRCECGKITEVRYSTLKNGAIDSCGCKRVEDITIHGLSATRIYQTWVDMHRRCNNPDRDDYKYYGGRGIRVDPSWNDINQFLIDMGHPPSDDHTIDRKDVTRNYCKDNCRWATRLEQANNKTTNVFLEYDNRSQTISEWARELDVNPHSLRNRIYLYGWSVEKALTTPYR